MSARDTRSGVSFAVFMSRKSGRRGPPARFDKAESERCYQLISKLLTLRVPRSAPNLQLAQSGLQRCAYLTGEMLEIQEKAPEAALVVARSIVETALVGSYLAFDSTNMADRMMKSMAGPARRLRTRLLDGDLIAALELLPETKLVSDPLGSGLQEVARSPDLWSICVALDQHLPYRDGGLATLLYDETYSVLSNYVVHPTPHTLDRHRSPLPSKSRASLPIDGVMKRLRRKSLDWRRFKPASLGVTGAGWASTGAMIALAASFARSLGDADPALDAGARDIASHDGYFWSSSTARMVAVREIAQMIQLPSLRHLNLAGIVVRALAASSAFQALDSAGQLIVASEVIDWARSRRKASLFPRRAPSTGASGPTAAIAQGDASNSAQAQVAALALVYASAWPDDRSELKTRLADFDRSAPHETGQLNRLLQTNPGSLRNLREAHRRQVEAMP